ncbi:pentatricopeptide repeat-containing protein At1g18900-like [Aristolochia californica]|uniref:pentatricopeptide repeat-containing protein At1g18900-like n=1 Tax=Aristolochia californica TaxID=171875 RepID=UPI0035E163F7
MLKTKQLGTLSQCARSFFLGGSRSGTADGASTACPEDESCISKKPTILCQKESSNVVPMVVPLGTKLTGDHKAENSGNSSISEGLPLSKSPLLSVCVGPANDDPNGPGLSSMTITDHLVKAGVATVIFLSDVVNYKLPIVDGGGVVATSQNHVVDTILSQQPQRRAHVMKVSPKSSFAIEGDSNSANTNYHGPKSKTRSSSLAEGFQQVSSTRGRSSEQGFDVGQSTKARNTKAGPQHFSSSRNKVSEDCLQKISTTKVSSSEATGSINSVYQEFRQCIPQRATNHPSPAANSRSGGRVSERKAGHNFRCVEKGPQPAKYVKVRGGFTPSSRLMDEIHQILLQLKWGAAAEEALSKFVCKVNAYQANQVLKMLKDHSVALGFFYWLKRQPGFKHDGHSYTTMIGILGKARQFGAVKRLLDEMVRDGCQPNVVTYNRVIHGYGSANYIDEAMNVFYEMQEEGCVPDRVTYCTLIDIHAKAGFLEVALDLYKRMQQVGLSPDTFTYSVIINCLGKAGHLSSAYKLFCELTSQGCIPNLITYNIMIALQAKARNYPCALKLYRDMQNAGFHPDKVTYSIVMEVLGHCGYLNEAEALFDEMKREGHAPDEPVYGLLVDLWGKAGNVIKARVWYQRMLGAGLKPNVPTCNSLLSAFLRGNLFSEAYGLLQNMISLGLSPSLQTYTLLLSCCTDAHYHGDMVLCCELMAVTGHPAHRFLLTMPAAGPDGQNVQAHASEFFDLIHSENRESKRGLVDAVIDFLHKAGLKEEAGSVWEVVAQKNVYPDAVKEKSSCYWLINLHVMSDGTAVIALSRTLAWLRKRLLSSGVGPTRIDIVTGWGRRSRVTGSSLVRQTVQDLLDMFKFPFFTQNGNTGCFVGYGEPLNAWLLQPCIERMHLLEPSIHMDLFMTKLVLIIIKIKHYILLRAEFQFGVVDCV